MAERGREPAREIWSCSPSPGHQPVHSVTVCTAGLTATKKKIKPLPWRLRALVPSTGNFLPRCPARFQQAKKTPSPHLEHLEMRNKDLARRTLSICVGQTWPWGAALEREDDRSRKYNQSQTLRRHVGNPRAWLLALSVPGPILKYVLQLNLSAVFKCPSDSKFIQNIYIQQRWRCHILWHEHLILWYKKDQRWDLKAAV